MLLIILSVFIDQFWIRPDQTKIRLIEIMVLFKGKGYVRNIIINDLTSVAKEPGSYLFLFFQLVFFSNLVRQFGTDEFLIINLIFSFILCLAKNRLTKRSLKVIAISILLFTLMNLISSFVFGLNLKLYAGYVGRIILGYLIVSYFRDDFFEKLENMVLILAIISLPFYLIQIIYPQFFSFFDSISDAVLIDARFEQTEQNQLGHKYLFVFLYNGWAVLRNSGFMWEPAAFGAVLSWAAIFNIIRNKFRINHRFYILLITAITTFSLGTYVYFTGILLILVITNYKNTSIKVLLFFGVLILLGSRLEFTSKNIDMMTEKIEAEVVHRERALTGEASEAEISRLAAFDINFRYFFEWPFGYGTGIDNINELKYLGKSPNGLMRMMVTWGIFGLVLIVWSVIKLVNYKISYYQNHVSWLVKTGLIILLILPLSGNPFYNQPLLFSIFFGIWVLNRQILYPVREYFTLQEYAGK